MTNRLLPVQQPQTGVRDRWVTKVRLTFSDGSSDVAQLDVWVRRAVSVTSVDELF